MFFFFFFNDTATTEIYTLSLHDALPISADRWILRCRRSGRCRSRAAGPVRASCHSSAWRPRRGSWQLRSEEHTSELQSQSNLVCRLLLEKKKQPENTQIRDDIVQSHCS